MAESSTTMDKDELEPSWQLIIPEPVGPTNYAKVFYTGTKTNVESTEGLLDISWLITADYKLLSEVLEPYVPKYVCKDCARPFRNKRALFTHLKTKHKKVMICKVCRKRCSSDMHLELHMKKHANEGVHFPCDECSKVCVTPRGLTRHKRKVCGKAKPPIRCPDQDCPTGDEFATKEDLIEHVRKHQLDAFRYKCKRCGESFTRKNDFRAHWRVHMAELPYPCDECPDWFLTEIELIVHAQKHAENPTNCGQDKYGGEGSKVNVKQTQTPRVKSICDQCGKTYLKYPILNLPVQQSFSASGYSPYICEHCGKSFPVSYMLIAHLKSRQSSFWNQCGICEGLSNRNNEEMDAEEEQRNPRMSCYHCQRYFNVRSTLQSHKSKYNGDDNYICSKCQSTFTGACAFNDHMLFHTQEAIKFIMGPNTTTAAVLNSNNHEQGKESL